MFLGLRSYFKWMPARYAAVRREFSGRPVALASSAIVVVVKFAARTARLHAP